jgi:putative ABC transport system ATP-binding protein
MNHLTPDQLKDLLQPLGAKTAELLETPMGALSGGQRQLISFIMATLVPPRLLLLDEPTAALDPAAATTLLTVAHSYIKKHGITALMITHDPYIALSLADEIWVLENGAITRTFKGKEKETIKPDNLIGHIDYKKLKNN